LGVDGWYDEPAGMDYRHDEELWQQWFAELGPRLLLFARQQTRSEQDAEDVLQDVWVRVWRERGRLGNDPTGARRFAFCAVRRAAIDLARRHDRRAAREQQVVADAGEPVAWFAGDWETQERAHEIQSALARVPAEQREVIVLKIWGELTFAEIAEVADIPANTAASRYRLGIEALRACLPVEL